MQVTYWTGFSKRKNSTKVPTGSGTVKTCYLKDDTSVLNPTIRLDGHGYRNMSYAQISDFGRYYYIKDVREVGPQTHVELTVDPAASHKASITGSSQYVLRANVLLDPIKGDSLNPMTNRNLIKYKQLATLANDVIQYSGSDVVSTYILGVVSKNGVDYIKCDTAKLQSILGIAFGTSITNVFYNMSNCIVSLLRVPYNPPTSTQPLCIGDLTTGDSAAVITDGYITQTISETLIPFASDDHLNYGSYIDYPPFTSGVIYLPFVGLVPLDMSILGTTKKIAVELKLDPKTADMVYKISTTGNRILGTYAGNCGATLPIVGQTSNVLAMPSAVLSAAAGILSDNPLLAASGALGVAMSQQKHTQVNGSLSSFISCELDPTIWVETYTKEPTTWTLDSMKTTQGVVVNEQRALSGLSGFVQCRNAHVSIDGYDSERTEIETMLNNGIFIE